MRERRKKGNPLSRTVVITSVMPGFEKVVLGTTIVCTVLLAEKSQLSTRQAGREKLLSKGHCFFLRGRVRRGGKKLEIPMASDVTLEEPHPIHAHCLPHGNSFTPHLRDSQVLQLNAK